MNKYFAKLFYLRFIFGILSYNFVLSKNLEKEITELDQIILDKQTNIDQKKIAYKNLSSYIAPLENLVIKKINFELPFIDNSNETYKPSNPSIIKSEFGYLVICRTVNYSLIKTRYALLPGCKKYHSRNFLLKYDKDFNLLSQHEIVDNLQIERFESKNLGLEDCRIFKWDNNYWFSCTSYDTNPDAMPQIALCKLPKDIDSKKIDIESFILLKGPNTNIPEKNWLPFIKNNKLSFMHSYSPLIFLKPEIKTAGCSIKERNIENLDFSTFRGSAGPIEFENGYLIMTHEMLRQYINNVYRNDKKYFHRFLYFDRKFNLKRISKPFIFKHLGIEFCCAMTLDYDLKNLIMTLGIEDNEAYIASIDIDRVKYILNL